MPKMKTHRGAAKRFRVSGTGKVRRRKAYRSHLNGKKSPKRLRRLGRPTFVSEADRRNVERLLGG
ncbi:MAG: 50S ribosomal protein L35 [Actinobacteria bacterium ATB1]|nr:50S ribosomal protein L35 [Actinobacteria bacterium ATB1]